MAEEQRLINLEREVAKIQHQVNGIEGKVDDIKSALIGNEFSGDKGYLHRQADHEKRIARIEKIWENGKWFIIGMGVAAGYGVTSILQAVAAMISTVK